MSAALEHTQRQLVSLLTAMNHRIARQVSTDTDNAVLANSKYVIQSLEVFMRRALAAILCIYAVHIPLSSAEAECGLPSNFPENVEIVSWRFSDTLITHYKPVFRDVEGNWLFDISCFESKVIVSDASLTERQYINEPFFRLPTLYYETWKNFELIGEFRPGISKFAVFSANTYGGKSSHIVIFKVEPEFRHLSSEHGYLDTIHSDGFSIRYEEPWEEIDPECRKNISMANWPYKKLNYTFTDENVKKTVVSSSACD